ncbi:putative oligomeric Golgi complex subunit 4 like protein [Danaus plexippus plexippus]|uniref:Conserved oligomeric Golgi complex subunit 4 n=1 Tax=Danaus plexippus plexippus TaxID=278856 RepID=A0A212F7W5_DANPL|nr:putative oligomeric Golgi complex subunit 4 like protein [Danaus plexippus plexippus]
MSLTLLLEKYDVSTEEGLQKALNEIEKEECEVDEALSSALSRACTLEGRLRSASQAYSKLGEVKNDAQVAADMVDKTAGLARDVSAKVRQLDLARSRVAECQRRVHDLIDLRVCSAGVEAAIKAQDYETAAGHVSRFLSMEPGSVAAARARGPDPRTDMDAAARTLRDQLRIKFEEAAKIEDDASVERLFRLFPEIGRAEEGVELLTGYLAAQLEASLRRAGQSRSGGAVFADTLTRALETAAAAVERLRRLLPPSRHMLLVQGLRALQPTVCSSVRRIWSELSPRPRPRPPHDKPDPLRLEPALSELALALSRMQLYFNFLRRRPEHDASLTDDARRESVRAIDRIIAECDMTLTAQEHLAHYLELERYFLEESVNKAMKLSAASCDDPGSSLVDDVFYITRKVIRRAISTGSVDGMCAVMNEAGAQLERAARALRRGLAVTPHDVLPLAPPRSTPAPAPPEAELYLAHLAEAEAGAEWTERLATEACSEAEAAARASAGACDKLRSCAAGLSGAAASFRAVTELGVSSLRAALLPAVTAWGDALVDPDSDVDELAEEAGALPAALDTLAEALRGRLASAGDLLLTGVLDDLLTRAHRTLLKNTYDRRGGLATERRCRRVSLWAGTGAPAAREKARALSAAAALLALERLEHAPDALPPAALTPAAARDVLARRSDFKLEDIKRLKL